MMSVSTQSQRDKSKATEVYEENIHFVVYIINYTVSPDLFWSKQGTGSGVVWDKERRLVITNFHVIINASGLRVILADQTSYWAEVVHFQMDLDLAILLLVDAPRDKLKPITAGDSDNLLVGQDVFAIGSPFELSGSLSTGVISAIHREIPFHEDGVPIKGMIQIDAAINPGNSGGPLFDSSRKLIGINTGLFSPCGVFSGVGFAIPVNTVSNFVDQLASFGKVPGPNLGNDSIPNRSVELSGDIITSANANLMKPREQAGRGAGFYFAHHVSPFQATISDGISSPVDATMDTDFVLNAAQKYIRFLDEKPEFLGAPYPTSLPAAEILVSMQHNKNATTMEEDDMDADFVLHEVMDFIRFLHAEVKLPSAPSPRKFAHCRNASEHVALQDCYHRCSLFNEHYFISASKDYLCQ